jgi:cytochrome c peroxidase
MAKVQLGKALSEAETAEIVAFLESLTGPLPANFANPPVLSPAGFDEARSTPAAASPGK